MFSTDFSMYTYTVKNFWTGFSNSEILRTSLKVFDLGKHYTQTFIANTLIYLECVSLNLSEINI